VSYPVTLTGPRLVLREFAKADATALHAIYGDALTTEHLSFEPRTPEQVVAIVDRIIASAKAEPRVDYSLAVCLGDGELIGMGRLALGKPDAAGPLAGLDPTAVSAQFGLAIGADHWHRGYGREALDLLLDYAFDTLGVEEVWGARGPANQASKKLMERRGFTETITIKDHITKNGVPRDSIVHVLDRADRFQSCH
jgi:ribosomal-protein-alanine N-acetyltransferase